MRIIKLSDKDPDMRNMAAVRVFFSTTLHSRKPSGRFNFTGNKIRKDGLQLNEWLVFTYDAKIVYIANVESGVEEDGKSKFFCININTIKKGNKKRSQDLQHELNEIMKDDAPNLSSQPWNEVNIDHETARSILQKFILDELPPEINANQSALEDKAKKLLEFLVGKLENISVGKPETYTTYSECLDYLGVKEITGTHGETLEREGLVSLANWVEENCLPAITGLIVSKSTYEPGKGYYKVYNKSKDDYVWWRDEIEKSKNFDWSAYVEEKKTSDEKVGNAGRKASDISKPPERVKSETLRIIRDTKLSHVIKEKNERTCQLCKNPLYIDKPNDEKYVEVHHIQPLGQPHNGPDIEANMICVCPNCHALLDYGAIELPKKIKGGHEIEQDYINYHNDKIYKKI